MLVLYYLWGGQMAGWEACGVWESAGCGGDGGGAGCGGGESGRER